MKAARIGILSAMGAAALLLLPWQSTQVGAMPDNLWTSSGVFRNPSENQAVQTWNRTEFGITRAWLTQDASTIDDAWYARVSPLDLGFYLFLSLLAGVSFGFWVRHRDRVETGEAGGAIPARHP